MQREWWRSSRSLQAPSGFCLALSFSLFRPGRSLRKTASPPRVGTQMCWFEIPTVPPNTIVVTAKGVSILAAIFASSCDPHKTAYGDVSKPKCSTNKPRNFSSSYGNLVSGSDNMPLLIIFSVVKMTLTGTKRRIYR